MRKIINFFAVIGITAVAITVVQVTKKFKKSEPTLPTTQENILEETHTQEARFKHESEACEESSLDLPSVISKPNILVCPGIDIEDLEKRFSKILNHMEFWKYHCPPFVNVFLLDENGNPYSNIDDSGTVIGEQGRHLAIYPQTEDGISFSGFRINLMCSEMESSEELYEDTEGVVSHVIVEGNSYADLLCAIESLAVLNMATYKLFSKN